MSQSVGERYEPIPVSPRRSRETTPPSVVAFFYYAGVARKMWFHDPAPEAPAASKPVPAALTVAIGLCVVVTVVVGVYPQLVARIGELAFPV